MLVQWYYKKQLSLSRELCVCVCGRAIAIDCGWLCVRFIIVLGRCLMVKERGRWWVRG